MKSKTYLVLTICLLIAFCYNAAGQQQWSMAGGCKERTSWANDEEQLYPPFNHIVSFLPDYDLSFSSLTIHNDMMCAGINGYPNKFYGISMQTKDTLWSFGVPESAASVSFFAAQNDTLVFVGGQQGRGLYCLDRLTGTEKWFRPIENLYSRNPVPDNNRLYVVCDSILCLNIANGDTIWAHPFFGQITPAIDENNCYVTGSRVTRAFNKLTGELIWNCYNSNYSFGESVVDGSNLYTVSNDSVIARNKENGEMVWAHPIPDVEFSELETGNIAIDNDILAVSVWVNADTLGQIYILNKSNGEYKWHYTFGGEGAFTPVIANNVLYVVCWKEHKLYGFDTNTGEILFEDGSYHYEATQPAVYNHMLYVVASSSVIEIGNDIQSGIPSEKGQKAALKVYPNPGKGLFAIEYRVYEVSVVSLSVYNLYGEKTDLLVSQITEPGNYRIGFESESLLPGIYFCEAKIANQDKKNESTQRIKFVVLK